MIHSFLHEPPFFLFPSMFFLSAVIGSSSVSSSNMFDRYLPVEHRADVGALWNSFLAGVKGLFFLFWNLRIRPLILLAPRYRGRAHEISGRWIRRIFYWTEYVIWRPEIQCGMKTRLTHFTAALCVEICWIIINYPPRLSWSHTIRIHMQHIISSTQLNSDHQTFGNQIKR